MSLVSVVCCQVGVSATGRSLVQRSPTDCGSVFVCDLEPSAMRRPWPTLGCCSSEKERERERERERASEREYVC